ncbi:MAG: hypothetical protein R3C46_12755 [Hyphomonadaceae bacterium]
MGPQFSSVFQAGLRWNAMSRWASFLGLFGEQGIGLKRRWAAVLVLINNVLSVLVLARGRIDGLAVRAARRSLIATNPLILSTLLAIVLIQLGAAAYVQLVAGAQPCWATRRFRLVLSALRQVPDFRAMREEMAAGRRRVDVAVLASCPRSLSGWQTSSVWAVMALQIAMICVAAPVATSSYILLVALGGDARLMANIIMLTTPLISPLIPATLMLVQLLAG